MCSINNLSIVSIPFERESVFRRRNRIFATFDQHYAFVSIPFERESVFRHTETETEAPHAHVFQFERESQFRLPKRRNHEILCFNSLRAGKCVQTKPKFIEWLSLFQFPSSGKVLTGHSAWGHGHYQPFQFPSSGKVCSDNGRKHHSFNTVFEYYVSIPFERESVFRLNSPVQRALEYETDRFQFPSSGKVCSDLLCLFIRLYGLRFQFPSSEKTCIRGGSVSMMDSPFQFPSSGKVCSDLTPI